MKSSVDFIGRQKQSCLAGICVGMRCCWQITALELYLYSAYWRDPTTHGNKFGTSEQLESSTWYVHRDGNLPPKRLGIDITAGCKSPEIHAGLLIAAIDDSDGSGRALKAIIRGRGDNSDWVYSPTETNLIKTVIHRGCIWSIPPKLRLERRSEPRPGSLWVGPRKFPKGMRDKTPEPFLSCHLRIATWPTNKDWLGRSIVTQVATAQTNATQFTTPFSAQTYQVRVCSTLAFWATIGSTAVVTANSASAFIPANVPEYFAVTSGQVLNFISTSTSTGYVILTELV